MHYPVFSTMIIYILNADHTSNNTYFSCTEEYEEL